MLGPTRFAAICAAAICASPARAEGLTTCPSPNLQAEIREASGSSIDALINAEAFVTKRYGPPKSRRHVSTDEVQLIYRHGKGAVSISLSRADMGRISTDCIVY